MTRIRRRELIARGALAAAPLAIGPGFLRQALAAPAAAAPSPYGPLRPPNADSLLLPAGFTSRQIARGGERVPGTSYAWHVFSDGQATYRTGDGGWILASNSESLAATGAGASAIRFRPDGSIASAYRILGDTEVNCAGGPTPWGTWLSCEEWEGGLVWECDPAGRLAPQPRPAMGVFTHEAAAVDPRGRRVYMTEDHPEGGFYRFTPAVYPDLSTGTLEVAVVNSDATVGWRPVPDPAGLSTRTRRQVRAMTAFDGPEGAWYANGVVYFTTKGDMRVWAYDTARARIEVLFDRGTAPDSSLNAVDNVTVSAAGEVFVCEDGGNVEIGLITPEGGISAFLRASGPDHQRTELAGVVFDPSGTRLYFASMGAYPALGVPSELRSERGPGAIYEVTGPFRLPAAGAGASFGPPAGELRPRGPLAPRRRRARPLLRVRAPRRIGRARLLRRGLPLRVALREPATVTLALRTAIVAPGAGDGSSTPRPTKLTLTDRRRRERRGARFRLRVNDGSRRRLVRPRRRIEAMLIAVARSRGGKVHVVTRRVTIG